MEKTFKTLSNIRSQKNSLLFGVCEDVRLEVCRLCKFLVTPIKWAHIGSVPRVDSNMGSKVEIETEAFSAPFKGALEGFFPGMD